MVVAVSSPIKLFLAVLAAVAAAMTQFAWVSLALIPMGLMLYVFSLHKECNYTLIPLYKMPLFYICFIWFVCHFVLSYDFAGASVRDAVELLGVVANLVFFALFSKTYASRPLPQSLFCFFILVVVFHLLHDMVLGGGENKQVYAYTFFVAVPFLVVGMGFNRNKIIVMLLLFSMLQVFYFVNRVPALAFIVMLLVYFFWGLVSRSRFVYLLLMVLFLSVIIISPYLYVELDISYADELSRRYFNKGIDGRMSIWPDVINSIYSEVWFGKCSNCGTQYYLNALETRNLSSHNTFLELMFRVGLLGVLPFVLMLSLLLIHFLKNRYSKASQFGAAYLIGAIIFMSSNEFSMTQTFTSNLLFWAGLGMLYGRSKSVLYVTKERVLSN